MGAVGTVTYVDGPTVYAFGHELDGAGRRSLLLQDAYVYYVVNNPDPTEQPSYKLASPGHTEGILSSDTPNAVIGEVGAPPTTVPVDVIVNDLDTGQSQSLDTQVADETDIGLPLGSSLVDTIAPLEVAQAATQIYDGPPADESGTMCLRIYLRESRQPLGFCNRYVGTGAAGDEGESPPELASAASADVTTAFSDFERVDFAALHVTHVVANMTASRGLAMGSILSARAVGPVKAGRTASGSGCSFGSTGVRCAACRSGYGFRGARAARSPVTIHGPATPTPATANGLSSQLVVSLSGERLAVGRREAEPCRSLARRVARRDRVDRRPTTGCMRTCPVAARRRVFRDPSLLITGRTTLVLFVKSLEAVLDRQRRGLLRLGLRRGLPVWRRLRAPRAC